MPIKKIGKYYLMESQNFNRPSRDQLYISIARLIATRGTCMRAKVGCVICRDNRIISTGYNGPPKGTPHCSPKICNINVHCERAIHAEANAISFAAKEGIEHGLFSTIKATSNEKANEKFPDNCSSRAQLSGGLSRCIKLCCCLSG